MIGTAKWFFFIAYLCCFLIGHIVWYAIFPLRIVQVEFGSLSDWGFKKMKEVWEDA